MPRAVFDESRIHPAIRQRITERHRDLIQEVEAAIAANDIVVVGMAMNPHPRRARKALDAIGMRYAYLEYGSYLGGWRRRNALKMWTGWPTLPMIFVKGTLVGGASDLQQLIASQELQRMLDRGSGPPGGPGAGDERTVHAGADAGQSPSSVARAFLAAMERRDLETARRYLAPDFSMCFPGGSEMRQLEELVERSRGRYRSVAKDFDRIDEAPAAQGTVVYCSGRLRGVWNDGREFSGIRFIDRFEVVDGLIRRQDVWNDIGQAR